MSLHLALFTILSVACHPLLGKKSKAVCHRQLSSQVTICTEDKHVFKADDMTWQDDMDYHSKGVGQLPPRTAMFKSGWAQSRTPLQFRFSGYGHIGQGVLLNSAIVWEESCVSRAAVQCSKRESPVSQTATVSRQSDSHSLVSSRIHLYLLLA